MFVGLVEYLGEEESLRFAETLRKASDYLQKQTEEYTRHFSVEGDEGELSKILPYLKYLNPYCVLLAVVIMGNATTKLFEGVIARLNGVEGAAIDFAYIGYIVVTLICLYLLSSVFRFLHLYMMRVWRRRRFTICGVM